jgi:hypothetical protein
MRFEVSMAMAMKIAVFWDVTPSSLVEVYEYFRHFYFEAGGSIFF